MIPPALPLPDAHRFAATAADWAREAGTARLERFATVAMYATIAAYTPTKAALIMLAREAAKRRRGLGGEVSNWYRALAGVLFRAARAC